MSNRHFDTDDLPERNEWLDIEPLPLATRLAQSEAALERFKAEGEQGKQLVQFFEISVRNLTKELEKQNGNGQC